MIYRKWKRFLLWLWLLTLFVINVEVWSVSFCKFIDGTYGVFDVTQIIGGPCTWLMILMVEAAPPWHEKDEDPEMRFSKPEDFAFKWLCNFGVGVFGGFSMFVLLTTYYVIESGRFEKKKREKTFAELVK